MNGLVFKEDEDKFIRQTSEIAKKYNIYIVMSVGALTHRINSDENKTILIDNTGEIGFQYEKTKLFQGIMILKAME